MVTKLITLLVMTIIAIGCSACAAPLLLGVKSYESGDTRIEFITGADFTVGANGIDNVSNNRGIKAKEAK